MKKGLIYMPHDKMPAKPEALRGKATLDRSVSLGCVSSSDNHHATSPANVPRGIPISLERRSLAHERDKKAESPRRRLTPMNRSTSLWSVQTPKADYNQCRRSSGTRLNSVFRPSKIPLPAARPTGLGRSLADLSQVDRVGESVGQVISFELDLDGASDERIYENCRETLGRASKLGGISVSTSNLEERAARLMAQLEDDEEPIAGPMDVVDVALPRRKETVYGDREASDDKGASNVIEEKRSFDENNGGDDGDNRPRAGVESNRASAFRDNDTKGEDAAPKKRDLVAREHKSRRTKSCDKPEESVEESKRSKESLNIQELRRNWERHSRGSVADPEDDAKMTRTGNSAKRTARNESDAVDGAQEAKRKQCVGKRAKDIEHLVNFFNCKNAEASKETPREAWIKPRSTDVVPVMETPKKSDPKAEYSGYASDGNCSEDSGHMSNENEVEWKDSQNQGETADFKETQEYYGAIERADDMKIFDSTIARRLAEKKKMMMMVVANQPSPAVSSGASSIDSCRDDRCLELGRQVRRVMITVSRSLLPSQPIALGN